MASCERIKFNNRKVCSGDLKHTIWIIDRKIEPDVEGYEMDMTSFVKTKAAIKQRALVGADVQNFDGTNLSQITSHEFYIRRGKTVQKNYTIKFNNKY